MKYTIENYNPETIATKHTYSVEFLPYNLRHMGKVFPNRRDAIRYARSVPDPQDGTRCEILTCSFTYRVYYGTIMERFTEHTNRRDALRSARQWHRLHPDDEVDVGLYDVTCGNDIVCLDGYEI